MRSAAEKGKAGGVNFGGTKAKRSTNLTDTDEVISAGDTTFYVSAGSPVELRDSIKENGEKLLNDVPDLKGRERLISINPVDDKREGSGFLTAISENELTVNIAKVGGFNIADFTSALGHELVHVTDYESGFLSLLDRKNRSQIKTFNHHVAYSETKAYAWQLNHYGNYGQQNIDKEDLFYQFMTKSYLYLKDK